MKTKTISKPGYAEKQAAIVVRYGGADHIHAMPDGKKVEMPPGIAHFLEHKMFEDPDLNMFEEFTKRGASVNAYTHFTHTVYYFSTIDNFQENLDLLFRLVETTHFTEENVEKEKGIILSEIDMYEDNPYWQVYTGLHRGLFAKSPLRQEILGTKESVQSITPEQLQECFENFYKPENMALICVGDLQSEGPKAQPVSDTNQLNAAPFHEAEPAQAAESQVEKHMSVSIPLFQMGFKALYGEGMANPVILAASSILADMLAGESSEVYSEMYDKGMIDNQFTAEYIGGTYYGIYLFSGAGIEPESVRDRILEAKLDADRFDIIKSKHIGRYIRGFNSIETLCSAQADLFTKGYEIEDMMEAFRQVRFEDVEQQYAKYIRPQNQALSIIKPI